MGKKGTFRFSILSFLLYLSVDHRKNEKEKEKIVNQTKHNKNDHNIKQGNEVKKKRNKLE